MTDVKEVKPFFNPLKAFQKILEKVNCPGVIIGGVATSLLSTPRLTADIAAMILLSIEDIHKLIASAIEEGFIIRNNDAETFAKQHRIVLLQHKDSRINLDISNMG